MYAIRSYYAISSGLSELPIVIPSSVIDIPGAAITLDVINTNKRTSMAKNTLPFFIELLDPIIIPNLSNNRITSYNVCYTKLLRKPY